METETKIWTCVYTTVGITLATTINPLCGLYYGAVVLGLSQLPRIIKNIPKGTNQSTNVGNQYMIYRM